MSFFEVIVSFRYFCTSINLVVIANEDFIVVSDVLEFISIYVINVGQPFMLGCDISLPLYVCFHSTHAVFRRRRIEQKQIVMLGMDHFNLLFNA